ncbi:MAG: hypothetical protein PHE43_01095 [Candidatus Nanoarchaeia archaeon]|nr:hypothetical protein [Candidatus Nanoarchaeia archaeon]
MKRFHKQTNKPKSTWKSHIKNFIVWFLVYSILLILLELVFENTKLYQSKFGFYLAIGFILVVVSRVIYSAYKRKHFNLNGIVFWGTIYTLAIAFVNFILNKLPKIQVNLTYDRYLNLLLVSIIFTILIIFLRRMKMGSLRIGKKRIKAPSQIMSGVILIFSGILTFRFSYKIFVEWFNWSEGMAWSWLIGICLILGGALTIVAWWRNNVATLNTKHMVRFLK